MFPDHFSEQEVIDSISQAYENAVYQQGTKNTWRGVDKNGMPVLFYNSLDGGDVPKADIISAFPEVIIQ